MRSQEAKSVPDPESHERCVALMSNGKLHQSEEYCSEHWRIDWLEVQRQGQDESHRQDCNRAFQLEIQTWSHAGRPCVCCETSAIIVSSPPRPDSPDVGSHNVTMVRIRMRKDVLNEIVPVLIACDWKHGQLCGGGIYPRTHCQSREYEADPPALHKHARDSARESRRRQS